MKAISTALKSANPDADAIRQAAKTLQSHAGQGMLDRFPEGSLTKPTDARAEIWQDWDRFKLLAMQLETQEQGMAAAANNPITGVAPNGDQSLLTMGQMGPDAVFKMIGQTCAACHKEFRIKR